MAYKRPLITEITTLEFRSFDLNYLPYYVRNDIGTSPIMEVVLAFDTLKVTLKIDRLNPSKLLSSSSQDVLKLMHLWQY